MSPRRLMSVARFELGYIITSPVYWIVAVIFVALSFASMATENINVAAAGNIHKNAPIALIVIHGDFILFFLLGMVSFVAGAVVRDDETRFGALIRSTQITKSEYIFGRFVGGYIGAALLYLSVPIGLICGSLAPWIDPQRLGPTTLAPYIYGYFIAALPTIFAISAIIFALATAFRSMMASYLSVIALFILYSIFSLAVGNNPAWRFAAAYIDPFSGSMLGVVSNYWTPEESNSNLPPLFGPVGLHQLLWIAIGGGILWLSCVRYRFTERTQWSWSWQRGSERDDVAFATRVGGTSSLVPSTRLAVSWSQLTTRALLEVRITLKSTGFIALMVMGVALTALIIYLTPQVFGAPRLPITRLMITQITGGFSIFWLIVAVFYSGEMVFRERNYRLDGIIDATPLPSWGYVVPKIIALSVVLIVMLAAAALVGIGYQIGTGFYDIEPMKYLSWYLIPGVYRSVMIAILAVLLQTISPNRYVGWGLFVVYLASTLGARALGVEDHLFLYSTTPQIELSDLNSQGVPTGVFWFRLYWASFALLLVLVANWMWPRGNVPSYMQRLRALPMRVRGGAGALAVVALVLFVGVGGYIFHNTHVVNHFMTSEDEIARTAAYEKELMGFAKVPQPAVAHVRIDVDLHPSQLRAIFRGSYTLKNISAAALNEVDVGFADFDSPGSIAIDGATRARFFPKFNFSVFHLDKPMLPGETRLLHFSMSRAVRGFTNSNSDTRLVYNGTFLNNFEIAPVIGINQLSFLKDKAKRRKYGLPAERPAALLEDRAALARPFIPADWTTADITLTTDADQTPVAPGRMVSDITHDDRRTARFVSDQPILNFYSIQSARYAIAERAYPGVKLQVFYHPASSWNVDRMISAMGHALDYYRANFGPFQFDQMRIVEFPAYATFAQSFANTVPFSEDIGFTTDVRNPTKIDMVTYVTAHEVAHQYWAHQIIGADMQGASMLDETLAQYSALMVMKHLYGPDKMHRFLALELNGYLLGRQLDPVREVPLERVENQQYIHYRKGSLVMYLLAERLGEDRVNAALRQVLNRYKFKGAPYPRSRDLVDALRQQARTPAEQNLITDLFQNITVYRFRTRDAHSEKMSNGRWTVRFTVEAEKFYVSGDGKQRAQNFDEATPVGAFSARPDADTFNSANVLAFRAHNIHNGVQTVTITTATRPRYVGVDPYALLITRNSEDNLLEL